MSEQLPDIYISKECINDWGFDKTVTDKSIFQHHHYTPHAKLKEAEDNWRMFALAKLGVERDKMSPSDVEVIQKFLGVEHQS